ncbi:MAG: reprolysin-like metallopeptidase, partial [Candidatus Competibacter sp.]
MSLALTVAGSGVALAGPPVGGEGPDAVVDLFSRAAPPGAQAMRTQRATLGRDAIRLNRAIADLPLQAKARFALPRGVTYELVYDHRQVHPSGNVTWSGYLKDHGDDYRAVITFGVQGTFGRIVTPDGEFLIESDAAGEWLVDPQTQGLTPAPLEHDDAKIPLPAEVEKRLPKNRRGKSAPGDKPFEQAVAQAGETTPVDIDVMILYTPGLASRLGSGLTARLDQLVALSNQAYRDSGVYINLRLVHKEQVNYSDATTNDAALNALTNGSDPALAGVANLRNSKGADLVSLIRPFNRSASGGSCGVAWIGGYNGQPIANYANYGYSVISDGRDVNGSGYYCLDLTFVHELGHNMGSLHDRANSSGGTGAYPYSYGYGVSGTFGTVMSYINPRIGKFSNPAITCAGGIACGISETAANSANNVLS